MEVQRWNREGEGNLLDTWMLFGAYEQPPNSVMPDFAKSGREFQEFGYITPAQAIGPIGPIKRDTQ